jgi:hypothetical protein
VSAISPQPANIKSIEELPLVVSIEKVAELYGRSPRAIERLVRLNREIPQPFLTHPMRWSRADLDAHLNGRSVRSANRRKVSA